MCLLETIQYGLLSEKLQESSKVCKAGVAGPPKRNDVVKA